MNHTQETAETLALNVLGWLAANEDLLPVFLGFSGATETELRAQAADPAFLGAVLDFLMMDDAWVIGFCDSARLPYEAISRARQRLPGGEDIHWT